MKTSKVRENTVMQSIHDWTFVYYSKRHTANSTSAFPTLLFQHTNTFKVVLLNSLFKLLPWLAGWRAL